MPYYICITTVSFETIVEAESAQWSRQCCGVGNDASTDSVVVVLFSRKEHIYIYIFRNDASSNDITAFEQQPSMRWLYDLRLLTEGERTLKEMNLGWYP